MKEIFHTRKCLTPEEINGYIKESLPEEELHNIEKHLIDCELCSVAVEGWSKVNQPESVMAELEQSKMSIPKEPFPVLKPEKRTMFNRRKKLIASAAVIALVITSYFFITQSPRGPQALFEAYYEQVAMPDPTTRNFEITDLKELTKRAYLAYIQKDFTGSLTYFDQILQVDSKNPTALLYGGLAYLETGQNDKAIDALDKLASQPGARYAEDANWYLALALLKNNDIERSREVLTDIQQKGGLFTKQAARLATNF